MIKDIILSFKENLKQKSTNPFFGTLILVWVIHNWKFIYTAFNLEQFSTFEEKIAYLESLLNTGPFIRNLLVCIIITFLVIISSYLLINISRLIINLFDKKLTPWVYKITDKSSIVLKSDHIILRSERDTLVKKIEDERDAKLRYRSEIEKLEERLQSNNSDDQEELKIENLDEKEKVSNSKLEKIVNKIEVDENLKNLFKELINHIYNDEFFEITDKNKQKVNYLLRNDVIQLKAKHHNNVNFRKYEMLSLGMEIKNQIPD